MGRGSKRRKGGSSQDDKLLRILLEKQRPNISLIKATTMDGLISSGWKDMLAGFPKTKRLAFGKRITDTLLKMKCEWTVVLFVFHLVDGKQEYETTELTFPKVDCDFISAECSRELEEMFAKANMATKTCTGWYAVPSASFNMEDHKLRFFDIFEKARVWDVDLVNGITEGTIQPLDSK